MMSGVVLTRHGGPEALEWRDNLPVPAPGRGEVLVRVLAAGVNNTDINTRVGWYSRQVTSATNDVDQDEDIELGGWGGGIDFPRVQGGDLCGRVVACGEGVGDFPLGARVICPNCIPRPTPENPVALTVIGSEFDGAFAQFCLVQATDLYDVSTSPLQDTEIAAIPCAYGTAENLLTRAGARQGQNILVTGASGGVGMAAVQLARLRGAMLTGVSSADKADAVRSAGAAQVIGRAELPSEQTYDVVVDVVGGDNFGALIRALKPGGHYAVAGAVAGPIVEADLREIYLADRTIHGCTYQSPEVFERLVSLINQGAFRPLVSRTYPLAEIAAAQADFTAKRYPGKLVLIPPREEH